MRDLPVDRFMLVIGETGVGKSTLVNMLYNNDCSVHCCTHPQPTGNTARAVTQVSIMLFDWVRSWAIIDTVGVGDPNLSEDTILRNIRGLIKDTSKGVHAVVVVMRMARLSNASRANGEVLRHLFHHEDIKTHGLLVLTHWDGDLGNEDRDLAAWLAEDKEMKSYVESFARVILTNNQLQGRGAYPECRQNCLQMISEHLGGSSTKIKARPVTAFEIFWSIIEKFGEKLWRSTVSLKTMMMGCEGEEVPTYCGLCSICLENMEIRHACKLVCNHSFHHACVVDLAHCPECRADAVVDWHLTDFLGM